MHTQLRPGHLVKKSKCKILKLKCGQYGILAASTCQRAVAPIQTGYAVSSIHA